jgi:hypothetical protein
VATVQHITETAKGDITYRQCRSFASDSRRASFAGDGPSTSLPSLYVVLGRPYPLLQFSTIMVEFTLDDPVFYWKINSRVLSLNDKNGECCGYVQLDSLLPTRPRRVDIIVLSDCVVPRYMISPTHDNNIKNKGLLYWVMYIEWKSGIAERRGLGNIYHDALDRSFSPGPVWKEILLG